MNNLHANNPNFNQDILQQHTHTQTQQIARRAMTLPSEKTTTPQKVTVTSIFTW